MIPQEIIRKKRDKISLSEDEVKLFVNGLTDNSFSDAQIAAMSMAIFQNGMTAEETVWMTHAMKNSGDTLEWQDIVDSDLVCDKHSTGGVGDKTSLLLAPILAACDLFIPMISGRGLGHTGGTLDKFDSIPGYNTKPDIDVFRQVVKDVGCAIIGQTSNLAPADKKLYSIRDIVGTVESLPLITSSILSKKIASGLKTLVLDVKVGNGSFNSTLEIAQNLARSLVNVAKGAGLECEAILTDMNQVLGRSAGHSLEVIECIEYLTSSKRDSKLETITNELASSILMMIKNISKEESLKQINTVLANGKAAEKFERMINALGGSNSFLSTYKKELSNNTFVQDIYLEKQGWIKEIKTRDLGLLLIELGGGRKQVDDKINYHVGYDNVLGIGECVDSSTPVIKVYANSKDDFNKVKNSIINCFIVSDQEVKETESIYEVIK
jgi:thymidine phosphorylase|tara:strand:- start:1019 stop:2332 length:1314 start_codon:yes stop_codon:yes gene_type:complete